ncbi:DUF1570 domain-containing protein [uncultured Thiohalocapsa sp.]|uniref:DUF1570 domain-containing protein n=1 Tax=uncultured Thiohalocapsa sp. TaxID=768990 RepID=UPI0025CC78B2|nr:DUF1570 domain-containing protein [uncultured Thiohalocapsa sp.]
MPALLRITALVLLVVIVAWQLSTDDQRRRLLVAFGVADSLEQAALTGLTLVGPGFQIELLEPLPPVQRYVAIRQRGDGSPSSAPTSAPKLATSPATSPSPRAGTRGSIGHGGDPCAVGTARNPTRAGAPTKVHRYVDADGRVVFSDRAPAAAETQKLALAGDTGVGRFSAEYDFDGLTPPLGFQHQLEIDLDGVFHFLADDLGLRGVQPVHLRLRIVHGQPRFARLASATGLDTTSGFYTHKDNLAVVRWMGDARTRAVARHEIAHLALGNWLGRTPLWLNEGLAEVVERMRFQQSFAIADAPARRIARLRRLERADRLPALQTFLTSNRADWNGWGNDLAYPYAWSLVHFLLQEPARQRTVTGLLNQLAAHRCRPFDHLAYLERDYIGGLPGLRRDWRRWLAGEAAPLHF